MNGADVLPITEAKSVFSIITRNTWSKAGTVDFGAASTGGATGVDRVNERLST